MLAALGNVNRDFTRTGSEQNLRISGIISNEDRVFPSYYHINYSGKLLLIAVNTDSSFI